MSVPLTQTTEYAYRLVTLHVQRPRGINPRPCEIVIGHESGATQDNGPRSIQGEHRPESVESFPYIFLGIITKSYQGVLLDTYLPQLDLKAQTEPRSPSLTYPSS